MEENKSSDDLVDFTETISELSAEDETTRLTKEKRT